MQASVIKYSQTDQQTTGILKVKTLLNSSQNELLSIAVIEIHGKNRRVKNVISDTYYFVISGQGTFHLNHKETKVVTGDLVILPKGTIYQDSGEMKLLAISSPRFKPDNVFDI